MRIFGSMTTLQRISIPVIIITLVSIGFLQYSWFSRSATMEISQAYRHISVGVVRSTAREYQRYQLLVKSLDFEGPGGKTGVELEEILDMYGPDGSVPNIVEAVAYTKEPAQKGTSAGALHVLYAGEDTWKTMDADFLETLQKRIQNDLSEGRETFYIPQEGPLKEKTLLVTLRGDGSLVLVVADTKGFLEHYIKPAVESDLSGYSIEWNSRKYLPEDHIKGFELFNTGTYRFNPFRGFLGSGGLLSVNNESQALYVPIPGLEAIWNSVVVPARGIPRAADSNASLSGESANVSEPVSEEDRSLPFSQFFRKEDSWINSENFVKITKSGNSPASLIESRLALNWFLSILLLLGVAAAFIFTVIQIGRQREMQQREREFVASVTHELRTPLTVIRSAADNLSSGTVPFERLETYGKMIHEQAHRLGNMVEEVLLFSGMEGQKRTEVHSAETYLHRFFDDLQQNLLHYTVEAGVETRWDYTGLPVRAVVDSESLQLVVENLVTNAAAHAYTDLEADETGEIRISARYRAPREIVVTVEDDGYGIPPGELKHIFDPFYRGKRSRENHERGSGLGLYLAGRKAEAMGGSLIVKSPYEGPTGERRQGSRFMLVIPFNLGKGGSNGENPSD